MRRARRRPCARARVVGGRLRDQHGAGPPERPVDARHLPCALAAGLLARTQHELEPGAAAGGGDALRGDHDRREPALHVALPRPYSRSPSISPPSGSRLPLRPPQRHRVEVRGHAERRALAGRAAPPADPAGAELVRRDREPRRLQAPADQLRRGGLAAGRVDRVDPDQFAGELDDLAHVEAAPTGRRSSPAPTATPSSDPASAPRPVSPRTFSSSYVRSRGFSELSTVPSQQPRKPIGMQ